MSQDGKGNSAPENPALEPQEEHTLKGPSKTDDLVPDHRVINTPVVGASPKGPNFGHPMMSPMVTSRPDGSALMKAPMTKSRSKLTDIPRVASAPSDLLRDGDKMKVKESTGGEIGSIPVLNKENGDSRSSSSCSVSSSSSLSGDSSKEACSAILFTDNDPVIGRCFLLTSNNL